MDLASVLASHGLIPRGGFDLDPALDAELLARFPGARQLVLVGNAGSAIWPHFAPWLAAHPDAANPLDDWTGAVLGGIAAELDVPCLFPFGGPPWWPFQRWAQRAEAVWPSPVAMLIHPDYGLWHAWRGALLLREPVMLPEVILRPSPCDACPDRPCLKGCPVGAFTGASYDVAACAAHLHGPAGAPCRDGGCLARRACPVGTAFRYAPDHAAFHMAAFIRAHPQA